MKYSVSEISELIRERRTVKPKDFTDRTVQKDMLERILSNATWAPNHGMTQPWSYTVFMGDGRPRLADTLGSAYKAETAPELFLPRKFDKLRNNVLKSSVTIAICMKRQESRKITELDEILAVACGVQNMHLTCTAYGLGAFWATPSIMNTQEVKTFLGLQEEDRCLGFFYIGYPAIDWPKGYRSPLPEHVEWIEE